ncbi:MAG: YczE/YyaS/YitT family protein, partial [Bacillota bacterium]
MGRIAARYAVMILGFFIIAAGIVLCVTAGLGPAPWDVLHVGISVTAGIPLGRTIVYTGLAVIVVSLFIGVRPTLCTVLNMLLIGTFVDIISAVAGINTPATIAARFALLSLGIVVYGLGEGLYLSAGGGAGPRDGFMLGFVRLT